jgi:hypothetical protein
LLKRTLDDGLREFPADEILFGSGEISAARDRARDAESVTD